MFKENEAQSNDSIDIISLIKCIWEFRIAIFVTTFTVLILASIYYHQITPVYKSSVYLKKIPSYELKKLTSLTLSKDNSEFELLQDLVGKLQNPDFLLKFLKKTEDEQVITNSSLSMDVILKNVSDRINLIKLGSSDAEVNDPFDYRIEFKATSVEQSIAGLSKLISLAKDEVLQELQYTYERLKEEEIFEIETSLKNLSIELNRQRLDKITELEEKQKNIILDLKSEIKIAKEFATKKRNEKIKVLQLAYNIAKSSSYNKTADSIIERGEISNNTVPLYMQGEFRLKQEIEMLKSSKVAFLQEEKIYKLELDLANAKQDKELYMLKNRTSESYLSKEAQELKQKISVLKLEKFSDLEKIKFKAAGIISSSNPIKPAVTLFFLLAFILGVVIGLLVMFVCLIYRKYKILSDEV